MSQLKAQLFFGVQIWNDCEEKQSPEWYQDGYGEELDKKFATELTAAGLQIVQYRRDGSTYSDNVYFIAGKESLKEGDIVCLGQTLPQVNDSWKNSMKVFFETFAAEFSLPAWTEPEFMLCAYSAE